MNSRTPTETQKFTSDIAWVALSDLLATLTGIVILPALTKNYSSDLYGVWAQIGVTVGLLTPILILHLSTAVVRFLAGEEDKEKRRRAFSTMLWPILAFACFAILVSLVLRQNLSILLFSDPKYVFFAPLTFLWASLAALRLFFFSYLRARRKIKRLSLISVTFSVAKMAVIVSLAISGFNLEWIIACLIAQEALFAAVVFRMIVKEIGSPQMHLGGLNRFLAFSVPQIPSGFLLWIINASDRYFITHLLNLSQTGIYTASYNLGTLTSLFFAPVSFVLFPTVSRFWEQKELSMVKGYLEYSTRLFLTLAIPSAAGLYLLSQPLLLILTTSEYVAGGGLILLVALGTIFLGIYQINVYIILLVQQTKWLPLMIGIAAATNAGLNIALIPKIGIMAAAVSTIVSYFILATIVTVWARKAISYKIDFKFLGKVLGSTLVMAFCLRFIPATNIGGVVLAIVAGATIFALGLFLSKAFSREDRTLIREAISGLNPRLWRGELTPKGNTSPSTGQDLNEPKEKDRKRL